MKRKIIRYFLYVLLVFTAVFLALVFYPRKYHVPGMQPLSNVRYWNLPTGSKIAYTLLPGRGLKKPFPVIYLHGGPGGCISNELVKRFIPLSDSGYDVYLYDQVGSGHSDRLENIEDYTADRHKRDLEDIVRNTGAAKVILIGQSWGAILATLFAADNPDKVEKLIFTGPGPVYPLRKELDSIAPPDSMSVKIPLFSNRQATEKVENLRSRAMFLAAKIFGKKLAPDKEADDYMTLLTNETNKSTVCDTSAAVRAKGGCGYYAFVMTMRSLFEMPDPRPKLKHPGIRLYIMRGQCDNQKWGAVTEYLELFPHHRLVIVPGAGHAISVEQPVLYLNTLREFLND